jgi:hypothetical protein
MRQQRLGVRQQLADPPHRFQCGPQRQAVVQVQNVSFNACQVHPAILPDAAGGKKGSDGELVGGVTGLDVGGWSGHRP